MRTILRERFGSHGRRAGLHPMRGQLPGHTILFSPIQWSVPVPAPVYVHQHQCTFNQTAQERPINCGLHLYCATNLSRAEVAVWRQRERRWAGCGDFWPTHQTQHNTQLTHHTAHTPHTAHRATHSTQHTPHSTTHTTELYIQRPHTAQHREQRTAHTRYTKLQH